MGVSGIHFWRHHMSYRIEYDWVAIRLPKERIESAYEYHFILA